MRQAILLVVAPIVFAACTQTPKIDARAEEADIRAQIQKSREGVDLNQPDAIFWSAAYSKPILNTDGEQVVRAVSITPPERKNEADAVTPLRIVIASSGDMAYEYSRNTARSISPMMTMMGTTTFKARCFAFGKKAPRGGGLRRRSVDHTDRS